LLHIGKFTGQELNPAGRFQPIHELIVQRLPRFVADERPCETTRTV
jgi:hypothetical protein